MTIDFRDCWSFCERMEGICEVDPVVWTAYGVEGVKVVSVLLR